MPVGQIARKYIFLMEKMNLRLQYARESRYLTQAQIAKYLFCDQSLYSKYERGIREIPVHLIVKLAYYYRVSLDYLTGLTDVPSPYPRKNIRSIRPARTGSAAEGASLRQTSLRIRELREDRDLTQKQLGVLLKCDLSLYSKYEREERALPLRYAVRLARFYRVSVDYLLGLTNVPRYSRR